MTEYIFVSSAHGTFSRIDDILGYKSSLSKFLKIVYFFSDHSTLKLELKLGMVAHACNPQEVEIGES
jgi:hypothetical protein